MEQAVTPVRPVCAAAWLLRPHVSVDNGRHPDSVTNHPEYLANPRSLTFATGCGAQRMLGAQLSQKLSRLLSELRRPTAAQVSSVRLPATN